MDNGGMVWCMVWGINGFKVNCKHYRENTWLERGKLYYLSQAMYSQYRA